MIKVLQFGEGNFLRSFVDPYFDALNREGGDYRVTIVKPIPFGSLDKFKRQNNVYHVVLRGMRGEDRVEEVYEIRSVKRAIDPFTDYADYIAMAGDDELRVIISNTTEAGICFNSSDKADGFADVTYPAKLTQFLYRRFSLGKSGLYVLPVELIDNNADELYRCVNEYIKLWDLGDDFKKWNDEENYYCNTLVDRIVSGFPRDEKTKNELFARVGEDELLSIGEPFGLWAVEKKGEIEKIIKPGNHNIDVVLTDNISYYKKRKVRVLNGSHTNLATLGLMLGKVTVYDCMTDEKIGAFVRETLSEEIVPFVSADVAATKAFASDVSGRFLNPYLNHRLADISLNGISKWRARVKPTFVDYYAAFGSIPKRITTGFSYFLAFYEKTRKSDDGKFYVDLPGGKIEIRDEVSHLEYFASGGSGLGFMKRTDVWGEDLTAFDGFAETVKKNLQKIARGEDLI